MEESSSAMLHYVIFLACLYCIESYRLHIDRLAISSCRNCYNGKGFRKSSTISRHSYKSDSRISENPLETFIDAANVVADKKLVLVTMLLVSGPLGMLLDNYHGLFDVLNYSNVGLPITFSYHGVTLLKSALWVPFLFGGAGFAMSFLGLAFDEALHTNKSTREPPWPKTFYSISSFSAQYYLSGLLDHCNTPNLLIHVTLAILAVGGFVYFDGSAAGLILAVLTGVIGPVAEILLINIFHLYSYSHADWQNICSWIPWVYFLGAPAVLNLARSFAKDR